eukprot:TRINITY_DN4751_c0_g1_i1.p1 TRINITY_DN4751_c0_g1~~TRINITY_DN4751_c0_g1_i1.p1  ORF type:complete len:274 (+),score=52.75 TRINITY_DN4751_c0_g1_i1:105-926(+)
MSSDPSALLISDSLSIHATLVSWAVKCFPNKADSLHVITQANRLEAKLDLKSSSLDVLILASRNHEFLSQIWLGEVLRVLKPGGTFIFINQTSSSNQDLNEMKTAVERKLLLAGFIISEDVDVATDRFVPAAVRSQKPTWEAGSSFAINNTEDVKHEKGLPVFQDDVDDLIDEDSLLTEEDLKKPSVPLGNDCEAGKTVRKACKNCTCGRAEMEVNQEKVLLTADRLENPQSACGNCGLGDAFRCASCPYKGLPPFKLGEKIAINQSFLAADL